MSFMDCCTVVARCRFDGRELRDEPLGIDVTGGRMIAVHADPPIRSGQVRSKRG